MFDMSFGEMTLLAAIALIAIGPKQLPEVARVAGKMLADLRRTTNEFTRSVLEARDSTTDLLNDARNHLHQAHQEIIEHLTIQEPKFGQTTEEHQQTLDQAAHAAEGEQHSFPLHTLDNHGHDVHGVHGIHNPPDEANQMKFDLTNHESTPHVAPSAAPVDGSEDPKRKDS
jgi:Sec-independent protein translocase protein TatA